jgi:hypothetical protein
VSKEWGKGRGEKIAKVWRWCMTERKRKKNRRAPRCNQRWKNLREVIVDCVRIYLW